MENPKISVIIPCYNSQNLLLKALNTVPSGKDIELIVIDDGSTDDSFYLADRWRTQNKDKFYCVSVMHCKDNGGVARTMNIGFSVARGEYIVSLSSDDYYVTDFEQFRPYLNGKNDLVYFDLEVNDGSIWRVNEESKKLYVGAVKFIRRAFLGDTRNPDRKWHEDVVFSQELQDKKPKEVFTGIVLKHYNFPREGSLTWQATHREQK